MKKSIFKAIGVLSVMLALAFSISNYAQANEPVGGAWNKKPQAVDCMRGETVIAIGAICVDAFNHACTANDCPQ